MRKIAIAALLLILAMSYAGCIRIVMPSSPDGENNGGAVEMISEQEAANIAEATITTDFPDMVNAEKLSQSYASQGSEFYEFTYKKMIQVETDTGTIEVPRIVIVAIDKSTGEKFVAESL